MKLLWQTFLLIWSLFHISVVAQDWVVLGFEDDLEINDSHLRSRRQAEESEPTITSYHVTSTVTARYVSTSVVAEVTNDDYESKEFVFAVFIQPNAFISGFVMTVDGVPYVATVREKVVAQKAYNEARRRGQGAAQVRQKDKSKDRFFVDLNLAARSSAVFNLTYQELLRREKGRFRHMITIAPGQVVDDFRVEVSVIEPQGLESVEAIFRPKEDGDEIYPSVSFFPPSSQASVLLTPSREQQSQTSLTNGLFGNLEISYDVVHSLDGGDLQVVNGYFVHHISPEGIPPAPKKMIFVIDVSGSMAGDKMEQTKEAMLAMLNQLRDIDLFNVLTFQSTVSYWKSGVVPATPENIRVAQAFVRGLNAGGSTNIHESLVASARQFQTTDDAFPAVVFLTDGLPSAGMTRIDDILSSVEQAFNKRIALFSIGFGNDVDDILLGKLSAENQGIYRKVYHDSSASLQMQGFFDEVATPLLFNINIQYLDNAVDTTTLTSDHLIAYFDGGELVVAGKVADEFKGNSLNAVIRAGGRDRQIELRASKELDQVLDPNMIEDFAQRMWAFLTIKDLLAKEKLTTSPEDKAELKEKALELSLKYSFVTPLTSLLVIKPSDKFQTTPTPLTQRPSFNPRPRPTQLGKRGPSFNPRPRPTQEGKRFLTASPSWDMSYGPSFNPRHRTTQEGKRFLTASPSWDMSYDSIGSPLPSANLGQSYAYDSIGSPLPSAKLQVQSFSYDAMYQQTTDSPGYLFLTYRNKPPTMYATSGLASPVANVIPSLPMVPSRAIVGADPHFVIDIPHTNLTICFDIQTENGTVMNLVNDPVLDIYVNAEIIPMDQTPSPSRPLPSLISTLGIYLGHHKILVTPRRVLVDFEIPMEWDRPRSVIIGQYKITIHNKYNLTIAIGDVITMRVVLRNKWRNHPDHLDFTVETDNGFSDEVHGLLGQFQRKYIVLKKSNIGVSRTGQIKGVLEVEGQEKHVFKRTEIIVQHYDCWWSVPDTFIDGEVKNYFVPGYFSPLTKHWL